MNSIKNAGLAATVLGGLLVAGVAFAQTPPVLNVAGSFPSSVGVGAQNATVAFFTLSNPSASTPVSVISLPIAFSNTGLVSDCRFQNISTPGVNLNSGTALGTSNRITLDTPLSIAPSGSVTLGLVCAVTPTAAAGTVLGVAFLPSNVFAMAAGATTTSLGVGIAAGVPFSGEVAITGGTGTPIPPPPSTGAGGQLGVFVTLLLLSLVAGGAGVLQFSRRQA